MRGQLRPEYLIAYTPRLEPLEYRLVPNDVASRAACAWLPELKYYATGTNIRETLSHRIGEAAPRRLSTWCADMKTPGTVPVASDIVTKNPPGDVTTPLNEPLMSSELQGDPLSDSFGSSVHEPLVRRRDTSVSRATPVQEPVIRASIRIDPAPSASAATRSSASIVIIAAAPHQHGANTGTYQVNHRALSFEPNVGHFNDQVEFVTRNSNYTVLLSSTEMVMFLHSGRSKPPTSEEAPWALPRATVTSQVQPESIQMRLVGSESASLRLDGEKLPGVANYFIGNDPARWTTNVPTYARVRYDNVYPGIDLVYYGNDGELEYDFIVAPGGDAKRIQLSFTGTDQIEVDAAGNLVLKAGDIEVRQQKPYIYQEIDGARQQVAGEFRIQNSALKTHHSSLGADDSSFILHPSSLPTQGVSFEVGPYDPARPLIIDPVVLVGSTYLGGSSYDQSHAIAVDGDGNRYVIGETTSANFPITAGAFDPSYNGWMNETDVVVTKFTADGSLSYSTYLGGARFDVGLDIAVDARGNAYLSGFTGSTDFPITQGVFDLIHGGPAGDADAFVTKLTPAGTRLDYSTYLGGSSFDLGYGIAVDAVGNAYVTGATGSRDFPTTPAAFQANYISGTDAFVVKLNRNASTLAYGTFLGGSKDDYGLGIAVDVRRNAYVVGYTSSASFPSTPNAVDPTYNGGQNDAFVIKLNANGDAPVYGTFLGGSHGEASQGIAVDRAGNAYVVGSSNSPNFPTTPGAFDVTFNGGAEAVVTKLTASGSALAYSTFLGGFNNDYGMGLALDLDRNAYVTGATSSSTFPTTPGALDDSCGCGGTSSDAFVAKLTADGSALGYATFLGGANSDEGHGIAVGLDRSAHVTGSTNSRDFPVTAGAIKRRNNFGFDAFVATIADRS